MRIETPSFSLLLFIFLGHPDCTHRQKISWQFEQDACVADYASHCPLSGHLRFLLSPPKQSTQKTRAASLCTLPQSTSLLQKYTRTLSYGRASTKIVMHSVPVASHTYSIISFCSLDFVTCSKFIVGRLHEYAPK